MGRKDVRVRCGDALAESGGSNGGERQGGRGLTRLPQGGGSIQVAVRPDGFPMRCAATVVMAAK